MHNNHGIPSSWGWDSDDYWEDEVLPGGQDYEDGKEDKKEEEGISSLNGIGKKEGEANSLPFSVPTPSPKDRVSFFFPPSLHPYPSSLHQGDYEDPF